MRLAPAASPTNRCPWPEPSGTFRAVRWTNSIEIAATPETVWEITLDVKGLPALTTTVTEVERLDSGPLQVGSQTRLTQPRQRPRVWTVESLTAPNLFVWAAPMGRWRMVATHRITPSDDGCINELELELIGRGAGLVGRVIGRQIQASLATENEGFRRVAEERAAAGR